MKAYEHADVSRAMSHALRHAPWLYELELDEAGWTSVEALITALRRERSQWESLSLFDIQQVIEASAKRRHELAGTRIRALYGHSLPGRLSRRQIVPPHILFHGTSRVAFETIFREGLKPMGRQYVHLSIDLQTAIEVGLRKDTSPLVLKVDSAAARSAGVMFFEGNEKVVLAEFVRADFIRSDDPMLPA
jgi:putative RNA 2'-phosphotransferase